MTGPRWFVPVLFLVPGLLQAQQAPPPAKAPLTPAQLEAELSGKAITSVLAFARQADAAKVRTRAKAAYELALEYDGDQKSAREALGFKKEKSGWVAAAAGKAPQWTDATGNAQQAAKIAQAWEQLRKQLAVMHRTLAVQLQERGEQQLATRHFTRAVAFDPGDRESHLALGHHEHKGFLGSAEQVAFLKRMAAMEAKAKELGQLECKVEVLDAKAMPEELRRTSVPFQGAKTDHITVWASLPAEDVKRFAQWGERALLMLDFLLGDKAAEHDVKGRAGRMKWFALLHSREECDAFLNNNPKSFDIDVSLIRDYVGWTIRTEGGRAHVSMGGEGSDLDTIVAHATTYGLAERCNQGLGEGLVHAMTALMVGTIQTFYGNQPATASGRAGIRDPGADKWLEKLRELMDKGADLPVAHLPRERLDAYRPEVRFKAWSFVTWLLARHPDRWSALLLSLTEQKQDTRVSLEQATAAIEQALGRKVAEIEAEWRAWADGKSALAKAAGNGR